jgi:hypothetical protein
MKDQEELDKKRYGECDNCGSAMTFHDAGNFCSPCNENYSTGMPITMNELMFLFSFVKIEKPYVKKLDVKLDNEEHKHLRRKMMCAMQKLSHL